MNHRSLCLAAALACLAMFSQAALYAQPPGGGFGGPPGGSGGPGMFFGGGGILGIAMREDVQQELQLVDEQAEKLRVLAEDAREQMRDETREAFSQFRDLSQEERRERFAEIRSKLESLNAEFEGKLKKVLLPHQFERLKQIDVQTRIQQRGAGALTSGDLASALNLTEGQRQKLEQRSEEVQRELREKIRELQLEARNKMLDVLTAEQRAKLERLMGEQFQMSEDQPRFGGFRGREGGDRRRGEGDSERRPRSENDPI